jgi:hypothetical protein
MCFFFLDFFSQSFEISNKRNNTNFKNGSEIRNQQMKKRMYLFKSKKIIQTQEKNINK